VKNEDDTRKEEKNAYEEGRAPVVVVVVVVGVALHAPYSFHLERIQR
jgi:hypothetical protein